MNQSSNLAYCWFVVAQQKGDNRQGVNFFVSSVSYVRSSMIIKGHQISSRVITLFIRSLTSAVSSSWSSSREGYSKLPLFSDPRLQLYGKQWKFKTKVCWTQRDGIGNLLNAIPTLRIDGLAEEEDSTWSSTEAGKSAKSGALRLWSCRKGRP